MTTTEWFKALDRSTRKQLLSLLHDVRHEKNGWPRATHLSTLIQHLEDDHEAAKGVR